MHTTISRKLNGPFHCTIYMALPGMNPSLTPRPMLRIGGIAAITPRFNWLYNFINIFLLGLSSSKYALRFQMFLNSSCCVCPICKELCTKIIQKSKWDNSSKPWKEELFLLKTQSISLDQHKLTKTSNFINTSRNFHTFSHDRKTHWENSLSIINYTNQYSTN